MKKTKHTHRQLTLARDTLRILTTAELPAVAGAWRFTMSVICASFGDVNDTCGTTINRQ